MKSTKQKRAVDPTKNVMALVKAAVKSQKEIRNTDLDFNNAEHNHLKEIGKLRAKHADLLRKSDLDRLDKTRQVDVLAAAASAAQLATAVQTLAASNDRNAETLRTQLNTTATTMAKQTSDAAQAQAAQMDSMMKDVNNRIAELQKSSYTGSGRQSVADPQLDILVQQVGALVKANATGTGQKEGLSMGWAILVGAIMLAATLLNLLWSHLSK